MSSGSEFQTTSPVTRKLLGPRRWVLIRGTVWSPRTADRRSALALTTQTGLQVQRTSAMEGVVDKDRDLEVDPLTDGKPVKL